jgi:4'-phosphopantetheinyl transferase
MPGMLSLVCAGWKTIFHKIDAHYQINLMPLLKIQSLGKERCWALWHVTETEEALSFASMESCPEDIINSQKRLEWLAARALMKSMLEDSGLEYYGLRKDEFGKPFLKKHHHQISLSHSYPYVAAQLDAQRPVGIDLEQPKEKLKAIAHRVFSAGEVADAGDNIVKLCIYWCAKESLYKIYGKKNLMFTDHLRIEPFTLSESGVITGKIQFPDNETVVKLGYQVTREFVLVYTHTP